MKVNNGFWSHLGHVAMEEVKFIVARRFVTNLAAVFPSQTFARTRTAMLRAAGVHIGRSSLVMGPLRITSAGEGEPCAQLTIGTFTLISGALHADIGAPIVIGDRVRIGHDVALLTVDHDVGSERMRSGRNKYGSIIIGDGVWLASRVVVLPGIRIGSGAIVAAGSVVTRDVPENTLVAGIPARVVRTLAIGETGERAHEETDTGPASSRTFVRSG